MGSARFHSRFEFQVWHRDIHIQGILGQSWNSEVSAILPYEFQSFNFDLIFLWNWSFFHYEPKVLDFKKVFSNLEPEGQGRGIIMGVTRLLLLGPFYTIQINFMYFFAHDCRKAELYLHFNQDCVAGPHPSIPFAKSYIPVSQDLDFGSCPFKIAFFFKLEIFFIRFKR